MLRPAAIANRIWLGDICFLVDQRCLQAATTRVRLSAGEARLLAIMGSSPPGTVLYRERMVHLMWSDQDPPFNKALDIVVMRLRRKLALATDQVRILTLFGIGFQLTVQGPARAECPMCGASLNHSGSRHREL